MSLDGFDLSNLQIVVPFFHVEEGPPDHQLGLEVLHAGPPPWRALEMGHHVLKPNPKTLGWFRDPTLRKAAGYATATVALVYAPVLGIADLGNMFEHLLCYVATAPCES